MVDLCYAELTYKNITFNSNIQFGENMLIVTAKIHAAEGKEQELETVLRELVKDTAKEEGSVEYRLHRVVDTPGTFRFIEKFKDQDAFDVHSNSEHFKKFVSKVEDLTAGEGEFERLELLDSIPE